jgi:hypothetical protein
MRRMNKARRIFWVAAALALAGCGGGLYVGIGDEDDEPPSVSLVADVSQAVPGQVVRLAAAASDDFRIDEVAFYKLESDGSATLIANDGGAPYSVDIVMPNVARGVVVYFFARAYDDVGQRSDSTLVGVVAL